MKGGSLKIPGGNSMRWTTPFVKESTCPGGFLNLERMA